MSIYNISQPLTVKELTEKISFNDQIVGDNLRLVKGISSLDTTSSGILCFCNEEAEKLKDALVTTSSDIIIIKNVQNVSNLDIQNKTFILTDDPMLYFIECINLFFPSNKSEMISEKSEINVNAIIKKNVSIGSFSVIEDEVSIGERSIIHHGVHLYSNTNIDEDVIVQSNTVIGTEGLGFKRDESGRFIVFPHLGGVVLEKAVAIGSNTTIAKGMLTDTFIGSGTKIGNQVNIGHNVKVGRNCFISSGAVICGSVKIGDNCWIGPGTKIVNGINIGGNVKIGIGSVVTKDIADNSFVIGVPAKIIGKNL